jgi:beta-lactamase regulating signal transducer with metallopeptidase domain
MHKFNRFYLIFAAIGSVIIPLLDFKSNSQVMVKVEQIISGSTHYVNTAANTFDEQIPNTFSTGNIVLFLYALVVLILILRILIFNVILIQKTKNCESVPLDDVTLVLTNNSGSPYSYFSYIFVSKSDFENQQIDKRIIDHERTHVNQKHSLDILFIELLIALAWFNPVFYLFRNAIRLNHEFLADESVINQYGGTSDYQHLIVAKTADSNGLILKGAMTCPFNYLKTKKRLEMMTKMKITQRIVLKQCLLIPMILLAVFIFSNTSIARELKSALDNKEATSTTKLTEEETKITNDLQLRKFIAYNIKYPSVAAENKVQGKVEVFVKIGKKGEVGEIVDKPTNNSATMLEEVVAVAYMPENAKDSSSNKEMKSLEKEVKRIVNKMPSLEIPEYYGKTVGFTVKFVLQ